MGNKQCNTCSRTFSYQHLVIKAGEPEPEPGAVKPSIFFEAGAGTFLNISLEPEQQKFC